MPAPIAVVATAAKARIVRRYWPLILATVLGVSMVPAVVLLALLGQPLGAPAPLGSRC